MCITEVKHVIVIARAQTVYVKFGKDRLVCFVLAQLTPREREKATLNPPIKSTHNKAAYVFSMGNCVFVLPRIGLHSNFRKYISALIKNRSCYSVISYLIPWIYIAVLLYNNTRSAQM